MTMLITWLWQGLAIAAVTIAILACARSLSAATRHALWWIVCAGVLCLPLAHFAPAPPAVAAAALPLPAAPDRVVALLILMWGLFAGIGLVRIALSVRSVRALKHTGRPADVALTSRLAWDEVARSAYRPAELRISPEINGAFALGLGRPVILVSQALVDALDDAELVEVVLHEQAHLDRRDDWGQLLQAFVTACAGWHPAVWLIGRCIALEREAACDDRVIVRTRAAREYARTLAQAAAVRSAWASGIDRLAIPGAAASRSLLWRRVRRLLDARLDRATAPALRARVAATLAVALAVTTAVRVPPVVAFTDLASLVPGVDAALWRPVIASPPAAPAWPDEPVTGGVFAVRVPAEATALSLSAASSSSASATEVPPLPVVAGLLPSPGVDAVGATPLMVALGAPAVVVTAPQAPAQDPASAWSAIGRSATAGAKGVASGSTAVGDRAKDTSVSIGHFFSRAGKRLAGAF